MAVKAMQELRMRNTRHRFGKLPIFVIFITFTAILIGGCTSNNIPFEFSGGDEQVVVLLRNDEIAEYQVTNKGNNPVEITSVLVKFAGEILHVIVDQTELQFNDQSVVLQKNDVPEGQNFLVEPGETFNIVTTLKGESIGFNYLSGFRITYKEDGNSNTVDVNDPDVPETYNYLVIVE